MSWRKMALSAVAAVLFAVGLIGLFPLAATAMLANAGNLYTVGFSASDKGWHVLGAIGGSAMVASLWALSAAFRRAG